MLDLLIGLEHGFAILLSPSVQLAFILGLIAGLVAGFLPGLSPAGGLALAVSFAGLVGMGLGINSPVVFIVAVAYGTLYGRALAAINLSVSEPSGANPNLKSGLSSTVGGLIAGIIVAVAVGMFVMVFDPHFAFNLGPIEISALFIFLLLAGVAFGSGSTVSALAVLALGILLRIVGMDIQTGSPRLTFGITALEDGLNLLSVALGLFVIANVVDDLAHAREDRKRAAAPADSPTNGLLLRTILAVLAGFLPTNGATIATTTLARRMQPAADSFDPASQKTLPAIVRAAMNSDIRLSVSLIPLLLWLVPFDAIGALLRGGFVGQALLTDAMTNRSVMVWLVCATLILAHLLPLIIITSFNFVRWRPIRIDVRIVAPLIIIFCCVMLYLFHHSFVDIGVMFAFGLLGYLMILTKFDRSLLFFSFAIEPILEENIRRAMLITRGDATAFIQRPISALFLIAAVLLLVGVRTMRHKVYLSP
jgi:putative tricarboxylic transport membrane protein